MSERSLRASPTERTFVIDLMNASISWDEECDDIACRGVDSAERNRSTCFLYFSYTRRHQPTRLTARVDISRLARQSGDSKSLHQIAYPSRASPHSKGLPALAYAR